MAKNLRGTDTEKNLLKAFAGESMARMRYTFFAKAAKEEGFEQISNIFLETAENEKQHAKRFFRFLGDENVSVGIDNAFYPVGLSAKTIDNLEFAANGEREENTILYPDFARIALKEGFDSIAEAFNEITKVEKVHEARYRKLRENILENIVFKRQTQVIWKCTKCGYHHYGKEAPQRCPSCLHKQEVFELYCENY